MSVRICYVLHCIDMRFYIFHVYLQMLHLRQFNEMLRYYQHTDIFFLIISIRSVNNISVCFIDIQIAFASFSTCSFWSTQEKLLLGM